MPAMNTSKRLPRLWSNRKHKVDIRKDLNTKMTALKRSLASIGSGQRNATKHIAGLETQISRLHEVVRQLKKENWILRTKKDIPACVTIPLYTFRRIDATPLEILRMDILEILPVEGSMDIVERRAVGQVTRHYQRRESGSVNVASVMVHGMPSGGTLTRAVFRAAFRHYKLDMAAARRMLGLG